MSNETKSGADKELSRTPDEHREWVRKNRAAQFSADSFRVQWTYNVSAPAYWYTSTKTVGTRDEAAALAAEKAKSARNYKVEIAERVGDTWHVETIKSRKGRKSSSDTKR